MERVQKPQRSHRRFPETSPAQRNSVDAVTSPVAGPGSRPARITSASRHGIHCNGLHQSSPRIGWPRAKRHRTPAHTSSAPARAPDGVGARPVRARHDVRSAACARTGGQARSPTGAELLESRHEWLRPSYFACVDSAGSVEAQEACVDEEFAYQDGELNRIYCEKLATLSRRDQNALREYVRRWIRQIYVDRGCKKPAKRSEKHMSELKSLLRI